MLRLRGRPLGGAVALGSASVMRAPNGIPLLPQRLVAQMARAGYDTPVEPLDVVLVARDYESAASLRLPWARVVGIAAERAPEDASGDGVPTVVGLDNLLERVDDDVLLLIDGERGIVLVDPDGAALAAYQAERERIAPRRRVYLDFHHQPARTLDGREVRVLARAATLDDAREAVEAGADALFVPRDSALLRADASDDDQREALLQLGETAAGKPVTVAGDALTLSASALLLAATRVELTLAAPLEIGLEGFSELQHYLQETRDTLLADEEEFGDIRVAGALPLGATLADGLADYLVSRVVVTVPVEAEPNAGEPTWLEDLVAAARCLLVPVEVEIAPDGGLTLEAAVRAGAAGVIVAPGEVESAKERIRALDLLAPGPATD